MQMVHQLNSFELPGSRVQSQGFLDMDVNRARGRVQSQGLVAVDADRARSHGQSQGLGDIDDDHGAVEYPRDIGITPSDNYLHNIQECAVYCS